MPHGVNFEHRKEKHGFTRLKSVFRLKIRFLPAYRLAKIRI